MAGQEPQRIAKLLARAGVASRREIERMIEEGRISIAGKPVEKPATLLTSLHGVTVDGKPVAAPAPARLFRYHKPRGLLTTERDPKGRPTIYDRLPRGLPRVMPVGRLDMNTEGLLLLTTDGEFKRQLELPATGAATAPASSATSARLSWKNSSTGWRSKASATARSTPIWSGAPDAMAGWRCASGKARIGKSAACSNISASKSAA